MDVKKFLQFPPNSFSHASLKSLSLSQYRLYTSHPFNNCQNLKTLKLLSIFAPEVEVFNKTLASCPSLEVLVLDITCLNKGGGHLRIDHNKLKLLYVMFMDDIDGLNVSATSLDILAISYTSFRRDGFVLTTPQLQFNRNFWVAGGYVPHVSYNISKEDKSIAHQEFVNDDISFEFLRPVTFAAPSMSVNVDLKNRTEVERLRHVLRLWNRQMLELEIVFKKNNDTTREEGEKKENIKNEPFPNAKFRVETAWLHNFSGSKEEFALASCFIRYETVVRRMMIKTTSFPKRKKLKIEAAVDKLRALLTKDQWKLTIKCF